MMISGSVAQASPDRRLDEAIREAVGRAAGVVGLAGIALIHLLDLRRTILGTPYLGWMYIALIIAALACAFELVRTGSRVAWSGGMLLAGGAMLGYVLSRTAGLPGSDDDIGNWLEPLGLASLFVEGLLLAIGAYMLSLAQLARAGFIPPPVLVARRMQTS